MQIKRHISVWPLLFLSVGLLLFLCTPAHAITEDEVLAQVDAAGKEAVAGNVLVWFLCAVAFLKVSQKIDSFMASIGVNVGHTGGSMLSDVLIVTRALSAAVGAAGRSFGGKGGSSSGSSGGAKAGERTSGGPFQGGLAGIVSRAVNNSAIKTATENKAYSGSVQSDMAREAVNAASSGKVNATTNASSSVSSSTRSTSQQSASAQSAPSAANQQSTIHGSGFSADASGDMPVGAASVASDTISINEAEDESEAHPIPQSDPGISISAAPNEATDTPENENASPAVPAASMAGGIRTSHSESAATSTSSNVEGSSVPIPQQKADGSPNTVSSGEGSFTPVTAGAGVSETVQQAVPAPTEQPPISVPDDASAVVVGGSDSSEGGSAGSPVTPIPGGAQGIVSESTKQSESVVSEHAADGKSSAQSGAGLHGGEHTESVTTPVTNNPTNTIKAQGSGTPGSRPAAAGGSEAVVSKSAQATHTSSAQSSIRSERVHGYGIGGAMFMRSLASGGSFAKERNFSYSRKGTYGTAGFMTEREMRSVVDPVTDVRKHHGIILGELDGKVLCLPEQTRFNGNLAVYGASGSKKTRSFCMNMILQCASRDPMTSLIICDPKSELYEKTSAYLEDKGYIVRKFDLVTPSSSDSWNCLAEINGQELMAQLFCDVIIKNTGSERGDHFWDNAEMNLLKPVPTPSSQVAASSALSQPTAGAGVATAGMAARVLISCIFPF